MTQNTEYIKKIAPGIASVNIFPICLCLFIEKVCMFL